MHIPTYHVWEIEQKAVAFHSKYCGVPVEIPVDIELIIERDMGFNDILPVPNLKREHDTYGCLVHDRSSGKMIIAVDEYMVENNETTYRFTLAEEVAHFLLHEVVLRQAKSVSEWDALRGSIPASTCWHMERNAKYMAGAILMPKDTLNRDVRQVYDKSFSESEVLNGTHLRALLAKRLAPIYNVSDEHAMFYRLDNQAILEMKRIIAEHRLFLEPE